MGCLPRCLHPLRRAADGDISVSIPSPIPLKSNTCTDTAHGYHNEVEVGRAVREFIKESNGKYSREDIFITSKLNNYLHAPENVEWAIQDSLSALEMDYVDLYLLSILKHRVFILRPNTAQVHWPIALEPKDDKSGSKKGEDGKVNI